MNESMKASLFDRRNQAIDIFRGLTMLLMVFVNDFWTVGGVPHVLEHFDMNEDGMGVSDVVFPMFLFVMGMSVPYAVERRFAKGYTGESTLGHILSRTLALLLMGVFIVNTEGGFSSTLGYGVNFYKIVMVIGFFLIWNTYPAEMKNKRFLQMAGAAMLAFLAFTFRTPEGGLFSAGWWGILGLIGWAYCFCAVTYLLVRRKPAAVAFVWLALIAVNILLTGMRTGSSVLEGRSFLRDMAGVLHLGNASSAIMAVGGMLLSLAERHISMKNAKTRICCAAGSAVLIAVAAVVSHHWWIVSKIIGTLPWCLYVSSLSVAVYTMLRIMEAYGKTAWFNLLSPSGTATLTVYMMPYVFYGLSGMMGLHSPIWLTGAAGLLKCALFSLLCVAVAGLLGKAGIRLRI